MSFIRSSPGSFTNNTLPPIVQQANLVHKAFDFLPFVEKLPLQIECMTCYDNIFILGTNCGRMLINEVKLNESLANRIEAVFEKSISTTKKPILQLEAVKAFNILIALFDSQLHIFDLSRYQLLYSIPKTKGCSLFSISISADQKLLRLCVACKKKLQFFYTNITSKNTSQFMELASDLELSDMPRNLKFTKDNLIVFSLRKDYYYYQLPATGESVGMAVGGTAKLPEIKFSTGTRQIEPMCEKLHNEFFTLGVDENKTIVYDTKGKPYLEYPILWSSSPSAVCSIGPYLIGVLPSLNLIEIMTIQPHSASIQIIDINNKDGSTPTTLPPPPPVSSSLTSSFLPSAVTAPMFTVTTTMTNITSSLSSSFGTNFSSSSVNPADRLRILKSNGNSICYVATQSNVWCLTPIKINDQLEQILRYKNYELGLNLIASQLYFNETTDNPFASSWSVLVGKQDSPAAPIKANRLTPFFSLRKELVSEIDETINRKITNMNALDLFCRKKFDESLQLFQNMKTDPSHIIAFIPGLLPDAYRNKLKFDDYYPVLDAKELEDAIGKLIDYLQFKRNEYLKEAKPLNDATSFLLTPLIENRPVLKTRAQILQIIDTTLLKCYLKTKENLVPFFLRRDNSFLHLDESERLLIQHNKISELTILYEKKEAHEKALNLLVAESTKTSSSLFGQRFLIDYMKKLGNKNMELIFKYAKCVIEADACNGVRIFMGDSVKVDQVLIRRAKQKDKSFVRKKLSQPNILLGTILNGITKTQASSKRESLLRNEIDIEDDEDDEQLKLLDHEQVVCFLREKIEPKILR